MEDIIDVLFALDVFYTFRTAYMDSKGEMVRDGGKIAKHYLGSWFPIDILASMPLEYVVLVFGLNGGSNLTYFAFLKVQPSICHLAHPCCVYVQIRHWMCTDSGMPYESRPTINTLYLQTPRLLRLGRLLRFLEKIKNANVRKQSTRRTCRSSASPCYLFYTLASPDKLNA